jgi:hypothetical protein
MLLNLKANLIMTRSKIFLAGTTCLLAVVGFAATRAVTALKTGFYKDASSHCTLASLVQGVTASTSGTFVLTHESNTNYDVYTQYNAAGCSGQKLYTGND